MAAKHGKDADDHRGDRSSGKTNDRKGRRTPSGVMATTRQPNDKNTQRPRKKFDETPTGERDATGARLRTGPNQYVYCIIRASEPLRFGRVGLGVEPTEVTTVNYRQIAAVVSDAPAEPAEPTRDNVLAHERVNGVVMERFTIIPMSFGTVFKTNADIVELLRSAYDAFDDVLTKMKGKLEFGLKVLCDREAIVQKAEEEDDDIRRLKDQIDSTTGSTYLARMQYARMIDAAVLARTERWVSEIIDELGAVSVAYRLNRPIGDKMILNAAFLVSRERDRAFDTRVKKLGRQFPMLTFRYTGPWPPYNFVKIHLKLERPKGST